MSDQVQAKQWYGAVAVAAAFARSPGRNKKGGRNWLLSAAELRYLAALAAFRAKDGFVYASQLKLAELLGVTRSMVSRWERQIVRKGFAEAIAVKRPHGQWPTRKLKLLYPEVGPLMAAIAQAEAEDSLFESDGHDPSQII